MRLTLRDTLDIYQSVVGSSGVDYDTPVSVDDPFDPYVNWWRRWVVDWPFDVQLVEGKLRDYLFGNRRGDFYSVFAQRGILATTSYADDSYFTVRWMVGAGGDFYLVDFDPHLFDGVNAHVQFFAVKLDPVPVNRD